MIVIAGPRCRRVTRQSMRRPPPPYPPPQAGEGAEHRRQACSACAGLAAGEAGGGHTELPYSRPVRMDRRVKPGGDEGDHPTRRRTARLILPRLRGRGTAHRRQACAACAGLAAWSGGRGDFSESNRQPEGIAQRTKRVARRTKPRCNDNAFAARRSHAAFVTRALHHAAHGPPPPLSRGRIRLAYTTGQPTSPTYWPNQSCGSIANPSNRRTDPARRWLDLGGTRTGNVLAREPEETSCRRAIGSFGSR